MIFQRVFAFFTRVRFLFPVPAYSCTETRVFWHRNGTVVAQEKSSNFATIVNKFIISSESKANWGSCEAAPALSYIRIFAHFVHFSDWALRQKADGWPAKCKFFQAVPV